MADKTYTKNIVKYATHGINENIDPSATVEVKLRDLVFEHVNEGGWAYINPMSGMGIFEDEIGNYLCMETLDITLNTKDVNVITEMHFGLNDAIRSDMKSLLIKWETEFGLLRTVKL